MIPQLLRAALVCLFSLAVAAAAPAASAADTLEAQVNALIQAVAKSDATFIRNGDANTGAAASKHMRAKYDHFKDEIKTTDDFIRLAGTKSLLSGKPYLVKTKDGKEQRLDAWLRAVLASRGAKQ